MAMNKNTIYGVSGAIIAVILGVILFFYNKTDNNFQKDFLLKKSGEIFFPDLAKFSGCKLPEDSVANEEKYDTFAKCLTEKGVKMYGAFWCGHCQNQKKAFGDSFKYVTYIECAEPNSQKQLEICAKEGITGYPTWVFPQTAR